jgi:hypothetical protein
MRCPKCNKDGFKKYHNNDGSFYYRCSICNYETLKIVKNDNKHNFYNINDFPYVFNVGNIYNNARQIRRKIPG